MVHFGVDSKIRERLEAIVEIEAIPEVKDLTVFEKLYGRVVALVIEVPAEKGAEKKVATFKHKKTGQELHAVLRYRSGRKDFRFYLKSPKGTRAFPYPYATLRLLMEELYSVLLQLGGI